MCNNIQNIDSVTGGQVAQNVEKQIYIEEANFTFNEPLQPLFNCNYYNFRDKYIILFMIIPLITAALAIYYNIRGIDIFVYATSILLILYRIQRILQIMNVYNRFFTINGTLIPFQYINELKVRGFGIYITYKNEVSSQNLPTKIAFMKQVEVDKFQEQYNKNKKISTN